MARASYIWVVHENGGASKIPVGAFTVRKELVAWLKTLDDPHALDVWRCRDAVRYWGIPGHPASHVPVQIPMDDLVGPRPRIQAIPLEPKVISRRRIR